MQARDLRSVCFRIRSGRRSEARSLNRPPEVRLQTDFSPQAICAGARDPRAVADLCSCFPSATLVHLPRVHAKVYIADGARAVVSSGNLTRGGLIDNFECGIALDDPVQAARIECEIGAYAALGAIIAPDVLATVCDLAAECTRAHRAHAAAAPKTAARRLQRALEATGDALLRARLSGGTLHAVLARTIEFLLLHYGPMPTTRIHALVQRIHPDLCDDAIDRVIDGTRFGKKWKHAVRTAQQQLKRRGVIVYSDNLWSSDGGPEPFSDPSGVIPSPN